MKRLIVLLFVISCLLSPASLQPARADLPGFSVSAWSFQWGGLWRREVRRREIARWYRHYNWRTELRLWLSRRAEGVWVTREAISTFTSRTHCILRNPRGHGVWRIWRTFRTQDVRRFSAHYRVTWIGHINPVVADVAPPPMVVEGLNQRYTLTMDHLEITLPMEPGDPTPGDGVNEQVMIFDENGEMHFLGEPGFEQMPDTAENPNGFGLITTELSELQLSPPFQRINQQPAEPMPGMALIQPGVQVEWLVDQQGGVLVDRNMDGTPDPVLSAGVLGGQRHQGLIDQPAPGVPPGGEVEINLDESNTPLQLHCWELGPDGRVIGSLPGQPVIGPAVDFNGDQLPDPGTAIGGPIPANPTVRDEFDTIFEDMAPVDFGIVQEGPPTTAELADFNFRLAQAGFNPIFPPFQFCIRAIRNRHIWTVDRRFVMDTWLHHWWWYIRQHINLTVGTHRVWLTRAALTAFGSSHHHFVVGQPPRWSMFSLVNVRFFRVCYRIYCPVPGRIRIRIEQVWVCVPLHPENPQSPLMVLTTESNENNLPPGDVLAGLVPDPLPVNPDGVAVIDLDPVLDTLDIGGGGTNIFDGDLAPLALAPGTMQTITAVGNEDLASALLNNQLQLYCHVRAADGGPMRETFHNGCDSGVGCQITTRRGQGLGATIAGASDTTTGTQSIVRADDFLACNNEFVTKVCWWGIYNNAGADCSLFGPGCEPFTGRVFSVAYYQDAGGVPGPIIAGPFSVVPTVRCTGNILAPGTSRFREIGHEAMHPPIPVVAGQRYWVEIVDINGDAACNFFWQTAPAGNGRSFVTVNGAPQVNQFDLAFCVNAQTVPVFTRDGDVGDIADPPAGAAISDLDLGPAEAAVVAEKEKINTVGVRMPELPDQGERGPGPVNDTCAGAILVGAPSSTPGTTIGATPDAPAAFSCGTSVTAPGVWYRVIGNGNQLTADTCAFANYDSKITVYAETAPCAFFCIDGNDDACGPVGDSSRVTWCSEAGVSYLIFVHGFNVAQGNFTLTVTTGGVPCGPVSLTIEPTPAIPAFEDEMGVPMPNPTMLSFTMQADTPPPACPGDVDGDGTVGLADLAGIIVCWSQPAACNPLADQDGDSVIGLGDLAVVINFWGTVCP